MGKGLGRVRGIPTDSSGTPLTEVPCRNCGNGTPGRFCCECGQKKTLHAGSLGVVLGEALQDQLSLATGMPRTAKALYLHPGFLTREYAAGRIVRYIPPLRLYLMMSVLFFLALSFWGRSKQIIKVNRNNAQDSVSIRHAREVRAAREDTSYATREVMHTGIAALDNRFNANIRTLDTLDATTTAGFLNRGIVQRGPTVMFLLLPFYALLFKVFYWRSRVYYAQHFVYALHIHSFMFSVFTLMLMTPNNNAGVAIAFVLLGWLLAYLFWAQKRVYEQGWIITGVKYMAISGIYLIAWAFGLLLSILIAVALM